MAEEATPEAGNGAAAQTPPRLQMIGQYVKDMSFENVMMQKGLTPQAQPKFEVQVALDAKKLADDHYEVTTKIRVDSKHEEDTLFILEIEHAGRFKIENVPNEQLHPFLMIECPRHSFPYLRRVASDVTRDGGFPPMNLDNIDFVTLYRNEITRRAQEQANEAVKS